MHFFLLLLFVLGVSSHNMTMIEKIKADPKKFVEEMAKVDPTKLKEIVDLLEALRQTSHTEESDLLGTLNDAETATENAAVAVADAEKEKKDADDEVVTAQDDLGTAQTTAETNIGTATSALNSRVSEADDAQIHLDNMIGAHLAREAEEAQAQTELDGELPSLNSEQDTLTNVIAILSELIGEGSNGLVIADTQLTYTDAFNYCANKGGTIVMPVDKNEIDEIRTMIPASGDVRAWLGIQKDFSNNQWVRDDGEALTYTHWKPGGEGNQNEPDAAMVWQSGWDGHWYDMNPGSRVHYTICRV